nr:capsid protein [Cocksfoot mottle virus]
MMVRKGAATKAPQQPKPKAQQQPGGRRRRRGRSIEPISRPLNPPAAVGSTLKAGRGRTAGVSDWFDTGMITSYLGGFQRTAGTTDSQVFIVSPAALDRVGTIAKAYALWRPKHWEIVYLPRCSTQTDGSIEMGFLLDYADSVPTNTRTMASSTSFTTSNVWGGGDGSSLLHTSMKSMGNAVTSALPCDEFSNKWYKLSWSTPEESENAHLTDTYVPARFVVRSDFPVVTADQPGHLWLRSRILLKGSVSPSTNL